MNIPALCITLHLNHISFKKRENLNIFKFSLKLLKMSFIFLNNVRVTSIH